MSEVLVRVDLPEAMWIKGKDQSKSGGELQYTARFLKESHKTVDSRHIGPTITLLVKDKDKPPVPVGSVTLTVDTQGKIRIMDTQATEVVPKFAERPLAGDPRDTDSP